MKRRLFASICCGVLLAAAGGAAGQSNPRSYAVVSLIGDKLDVVTYRIATGSHVDQNLHQAVPVTDWVFDKTALLAADEALRRNDKGARVQMFAVNTPELFDNQARFFDGTRVTLPAQLSAAFDKAGATHLLLLTKLRGDARLNSVDGTLGSGRIEGVGYYIDREMEMQRTPSGEVGRGFLAPFAYIKVSLIDLKTSTVLREQAVRASFTISPTASDASVHPWDVLSADEKVKRLRNMLHDEVTRATSELAMIRS